SSARGERLLQRIHDLVEHACDAASQCRQRHDDDDGDQDDDERVLHQRLGALVADQQSLQHGLNSCPRTRVPASPVARSHWRGLDDTRGRATRQRAPPMIQTPPSEQRQGGGYGTYVVLAALWIAPGLVFAAATVLAGGVPHTRVYDWPYYAIRGLAHDYTGVSPWI